MKMGPWGGNGGAAFDIPEPPRSLQSVTIGFGDVINSIAFSYTDRAGQARTAGRWGGDGAVTASVCDFASFFHCISYALFTAVSDLILILTAYNSYACDVPPPYPR
jgi:hypothetical protein